MSLPLPPTVCFRVTRYCNARCGFCLAPPDGAHPDVTTLKRRVDWLLERGVTTLHLCGGEPTIHRGLVELIEHIHTHGGRTKLTTNGIALPEALLPALRDAATEVKVSLHGDRAHHDRMVGRVAFESTTRNLARLLAASIRTSVQTTVVAGAPEAVDWVTAYCLSHNVRRLSLLPFIPRGQGGPRQAEYALSSAQRRALRILVAHKRRVLAGRLDLRWLDFTARPIHVVEADGQVVLEGASEDRDQILGRIPG